MKHALVLLVALTASLALAANPPDTMNYQGVLRNASDAPLTGNYDIVFRFFDAATGGNEIALERHTTGSPLGQVAVSGGLFSVTLGSAIDDGAGPGVYGSLSLMFDNYSAVWLELQIGGEVLAPRNRLASVPWALNAGQLSGKPSGSFLDTSPTTQAKAGILTLNGLGIGVSSPVGPLEVAGNEVHSSGSGAGYSFANRETPNFVQFPTDGERWVLYASEGKARLWSGGDKFVFSKDGYLGIRTYPSVPLDVSQSQEGWPAGTFRNGINFGSGAEALSNAFLGYIDADPRGSGYPVATGGYFWTRDTLQSRNTWARISDGYNGYGVQASGADGGAYFENNRLGARAWLAATSTPNPDNTTWGTEAYGNSGGAGSNYEGGGGLFVDQWNYDSARLAWKGFGIYALGASAGAALYSTTTGNGAYIGYDIYKVIGSGTVSFIQNHPEDPDKVIVYHAPESSDVATFTRGSGRLVGGEARVSLDPTFAWVTNPEIGLTAHVTARGAGGLYVASVSTSELVVRALPHAPSSLDFDFLVYGLRIGFEDSTPVQPKSYEAFIPSMKQHRDRVAAHPELAEFTAARRFAASGSAAGALGSAQASGLRTRIHEFDPEHDRIEARTGVAARPPESPAVSTSPAPGFRPPPTPADLTPAPGTRLGRPLIAVSEAVHVGDVLVADLVRDDAFARGTIAADRTVVGVVAGDEAEVYRAQAPLAEAGTVVLVRVDAGYAPVAKGDLLCTSATPGYAMRSPDAAPGTIVAKALEPLPAGTGLIRALVMAR